MTEDETTPLEPSSGELIPPPEPEHPDEDQPGVPSEDDGPDPEGKPHRHARRPTNGAGWYMVLVAAAEKAGFSEVGWYKAHGDDQAKRLCVDDAKRGHLPAIKEALEGPGCYLRGVPARSWPKIERSGYDQPPPRLRIG